MSRLAIIGGTGLDSLEGLEITGREAMTNAWGVPSSALTRGRYAGREVIFLARHGDRHDIAPHEINYRANVVALADAGATHVVGVAAVGGITPEREPGGLSVPDQIVDYTWGRGHTLFEGAGAEVNHIDFTEPYSADLRATLLGAANDAGVEVIDGGTYAATQGPRLESAAEIDRMERDGCHLVGMTGMPEAALAREAGLRYAHLAVVVNAAAGRGAGPITMDEIRTHLASGMARVRRVLAALVANS